MSKLDRGLPNTNWSATEKTEEKPNIYEKLMLIQANLKAPKGQWNDFSKFKYRSGEDILEALKPLLYKYNCIIYTNDDLVLIGERFYVKATVTIMDTETKETHSVTAYAREEERKKGMDGSQITGSSSSYARKYAMNGMFAIDDNKDADFTDNREDERQQREPENAPAPLDKETATVEEAEELIKLLGEERTMGFLEYYNATAITEVSGKIVRDLIARRKKEIKEEEKKKSLSKAVKDTRTKHAQSLDDLV